MHVTCPAWTRPRRRSWSMRRIRCARTRTPRAATSTSRCRRLRRSLAAQSLTREPQRVRERRISDSRGRGADRVGLASLRASEQQPQHQRDPRLTGVRSPAGGRRSPVASPTIEALEAAAAAHARTPRARLPLSAAASARCSVPLPVAATTMPCTPAAASASTTRPSAPARWSRSRPTATRDGLGQRVDAQRRFRGRSRGEFGRGRRRPAERARVARRERIEPLRVRPCGRRAPHGPAGDHDDDAARAGLAMRPRTRRRGCAGRRPRARSPAASPRSAPPASARPATRDRK